MAEGARLESVYTLTGIVGSNPTLSAIIFFEVLLPLRGIQDFTCGLPFGLRLSNARKPAQARIPVSPPSVFCLVATALY